MKHHIEARAVGDMAVNPDVLLILWLVAEQHVHTLADIQSFYGVEGRTVATHLLGAQALSQTTSDTLVLTPVGNAALANLATTPVGRVVPHHTRKPKPTSHHDPAPIAANIAGSLALAPVGDAAIIGSLRDREGAGLRALLSEHGGRVRRLLRFRFTTLTEDDIDETMATASVRVWRGIESYDPNRGSLGSWFAVIAANSAREVLRGRHRYARHEQISYATPTPSPPTQPPQSFLDAIHECIKSLPTHQRLVMEADLASGDMVSATELAAALHTTKHSVYASRSAGRKALRYALQRMGLAPLYEQ